MCTGLSVCVSLDPFHIFPETKPWKASLEWEAFAKYVAEITFHWSGETM